jgi:hypothetical protein
MPGLNIQSLENDINRAPKRDGVMVPYPLWGPGDIFSAAGGTAVGGAGITGLSDASGAGLDERGAVTLAWQGTASTTATLVACLTLNEAFCENEKQLIFKFNVRKLDQTGSATDNANLQLRCLIQALVPGDTTARTIITAANNTVTLPAKVTTYTWSEWEMNIRTLVTGATALGYLQPGTILVFTFTPQEAVGTDLQAELQPKSFAIRSHLHVAEDLADTKPQFN